MKNKISALLLGTALTLASASLAAAQDKNVKIGVLSDQSGLYADLGGPGSTLAAQMAVEDSGLTAKGWKIDIISGDHQNKPDIGTTIARQWFDVEKVDSIKQLAQYRQLATQPGPRKYDADVSALAAAEHKINAEFVFPYLAHAAMEPLNCTVKLTGDKAELWLGTQMPGLDGAAAAKMLGVAPQNLKVHVQMAGGGFGRRAVPTSDYVVEAAAVAKAAQKAGMSVPIRMVWSREDDIKGGYYRPMHLHTAKIGFDAKGKITAWDHVIVGQSIMKGSLFESAMMKDGVDGTTVEGMKEPYPIPMRLTVHHPDVNVPVLW